MKKLQHSLQLFFLVIAVFTGILITKNGNSTKQINPNQHSFTEDSGKLNIATGDTVSSNWKTYANDRFGFTFRYPGTWSIYGEEYNVVNRSGTTVAITVNFIDTVAQTTLLIEYHLPPNGAELYRYALAQYESSQGWYEKGGKLIEVAGNKAIEAFTTISIDGRGKTLNPPLRFILIDFPDMQQAGTFELQFKTPLPGDNIEVARFNQLISTIKFTN
jgi:hypothetical protein